MLVRFYYLQLHMTKTLIIPDIHGKADLLQAMLDDHKDADRIIQLGDLANCVWYDRDGDLSCINIAVENNIEVLIGNHEHPYYGGIRFSGFGFLPEIQEALRYLNPQAATVVGDILITHAGLHPALATTYKTAKEAAYDLNRAWDYSPGCMLFNAVSYKRGGRCDYGGILWRDYSERVSQKFPQIFGHTKDKTVRQRRNAICIDCEAPYIIET